MCPHIDANWTDHGEAGLEVREDAAGGKEGEEREREREGGGEKWRYPSRREYLARQRAEVTNVSSRARAAERRSRQGEEAVFDPRR